MEILVGVTILLIVMGFVASYYKYSSKASKKSDDYYVSSQLAAAALEKAKGDISNPDSLAALLLVVADSTYSRKSTITQQSKAYVVTVKFNKVSPTANLLRIRASVKWDGTRSNTLGTVYPYEP